jgi:hypothetical protein
MVALRAEPSVADVAHMHRHDRAIQSGDVWTKCWQRSGRVEEGGHDGA